METKLTEMTSTRSSCCKNMMHGAINTGKSYYLNEGSKENSHRMYIMSYIREVRYYVYKGK